MLSIAVEKRLPSPEMPALNLYAHSLPVVNASVTDLIAERKARYIAILPNEDIHVFTVFIADLTLFDMAVNGYVNALAIPLGTDDNVLHRLLTVLHTPLMTVHAVLAEEAIVLNTVDTVENAPLFIDVNSSLNAVT